MPHKYFNYMTLIISVSCRYEQITFDADSMIKIHYNIYHLRVGLGHFPLPRTWTVQNIKKLCSQLQITFVSCSKFNNFHNLACHIFTSWSPNALFIT